ncbi:MAG: PhoH family protein [Bdellovibrionales bacterium]|nr:PhoH family protein [Bdellovibrionales bacterium]
MEASEKKNEKANGKKNGGPTAETVERNFSVRDGKIFPLLVGEQDSNLQVIERLLDVTIGRGNEGLIIRGQDAQADLAVDLLVQISELLSQGETIWPGDMERAIKMLSKNRKARLADLFRDQIRVAGRKHNIVPKTFAQKRYIDAINLHDLVFGVGPAGTGKTYLAMAMAVQALVKKEVKRVVLCRPAVEAGEKLGFLPGDMAEKVNPYLRPLYDALHDMVEPERAEEMVEKGQIEVAPLAFMRGRTLSNAFVILDEAQNTTEVQMKMLLTRLGRNSKCVITGDVTQIDLPRGVRSGMIQALRILNDIPEISISHFSEEDVIRHPLVSSIIQAYSKADGGGES